MDAAISWPEAIHRALGELGVRQVAYVPDAGHARLIELCQADPAMRTVVLTTEEEGVALAAGAWLGGQRAVLLLQSSGVGNCVNMLALNQVCRLPLLALVTMRGEWGEFNPWQLPMGQTTAGVLRLAGVIVQRLEAPESAGETVRAAGDMAFEGQVPVAVLIAQRLIGAKSFGITVDPSASQRFPLRRRELVRRLLADPGELLVVAGLGSTAWDVTAAGDRPLNFPLWGAMGGAAMIGLGLALARPERRVLVITGDGELLMGLGSLATIAVQRPPNLAVVVFDNERYGETGMQATHTAHGVDLAAVAQACGFPIAVTLREERDKDAALPLIRTSPGPVLCVAKIRAESLSFALPPKDGAYLKDRFRRALLGEDATAS